MSMSCHHTHEPHPTWKRKKNFRHYKSVGLSQDQLREGAPGSKRSFAWHCRKSRLCRDHLPEYMYTDRECWLNKRRHLAHSGRKYYHTHTHERHNHSTIATSQKGNPWQSACQSRRIVAPTQTGSIMPDYMRSLYIYIYTLSLVVYLPRNTDNNPFV